MSNEYQMIGYIHEGPEALRRTLEANEPAVEELVKRAPMGGIQRIVLTGVGSSYTAPMMALPTFRYHCPVPTYVMPGPELGYYASRWLNWETLVVAVSRSGERGVVVNTLAQAVERGAFGVAVTGVADNLLAKQARATLVSAEGPEAAWPKTKSVVAATGLLMRLGLELALKGDEEAGERLRWLREAPHALQRAMEAFEPQVQAWVPTIQSRELVAVVGTGGNYGTAIEGAMKVMEASSICTRFDSTDGLLNGPVGGFDGRWLLVALVTAVDLDQTVQLLRVARGLGAGSLCIRAPGLDLQGLADEVWTLPETPDPLLGSLLYLPAVQLLAYYWTLSRGLNPDSPAAKEAILDAILPPGREEPA